MCVHVCSVSVSIPECSLGDNCWKRVGLLSLFLKWAENSFISPGIAQPTLPISNKQGSSQPPLEGTSGGESNCGGPSPDLWEAQLEGFWPVHVWNGPVLYLLFGVLHPGQVTLKANLRSFVGPTLILALQTQNVKHQKCYPYHLFS